MINMYVFRGGKMNIVDIVTIVVLIFSLILGLARGFGKSLKTFTKGIFGIIISVFVVLSLGGMIANIPFVGEFITKINNSIAARSEFIGKLKLGIWVYYLILFFVAQLARVLIVKVVVDIFQADNQVMRSVNKILGATFAPAAVFMFVLLVLALFKSFESLNFVKAILSELEDSYLLILYANNPINLTL